METITVVGYGSLLSEASARQTAPGLARFRLGRVEGYRRIFNKVGIVFLARDGADPSGPEISSCSTQPDPERSIDVALFEVGADEFAAIYEREHRFRWVEVTVQTAAGPAIGRMCTEYNDADYRLNKCVTEAEYQRRVGRWYAGPIWRDDILPYPPYLRHCLRAAEGQGLRDRFLDSTFLADGVTTLRDYLAARPDLADGEAVHAYPAG